MIIEKIVLENFMCFAGKNTLDFSEGINVIIGDNGYGKSKLYDAFYWVMYDQIFSPEKKEFQKTKELKSKIVSDKTKFDTKSGKIVASVSITFHDKKSDSVFIIERKYEISIDDGKVTENNDSELTVMRKELSYLKAKIIFEEEEKKRILSIILPAQIKDYLWFQGEQVESIIDFNKQDTLTKAINVLSNLTRYDEIKEISIAAAKTANNEYDREVKRLSIDANKSELLEKDKFVLEEKIDNLLADEKEAKDNLSIAEERCETLLNKIGDATKVTELQNKKKVLTSQLNDYSEQLSEEQMSFHRKMFKNKWILKGTESLYEEYAQRYSNYENKKLETVADLKARQKLDNEIIKKMQFRLPIDVPEPIYVNRMLEVERCLVCDREAKKDSDPWNKMKELVDRPDKELKSKLEEITPYQNFSNDFKKLYQNGLSLSHRIEEIDSDISETLNKITTIQSKIRESNSAIEKLEEDIQKLLSESSLNAESAENILAEYSIQNKYVKDFMDQLNKITQQLDNHKSNLQNINEQLKSLVRGELPKWLIEKRIILNDFQSIAKNTRDRVFRDLILLLEKEANLHYEAMTASNRSARGQIRLRELANHNYMPEIIDDNGNPLLGSNTSNLILVKLSAIMAIISAKSNSGLVNLYTLIADAPTSVFGEDYTIGFCKTISKVYKQSIIMSKEFYKNQNLRNELLTNPDIKIGKVYTITPSILPTERSSRNNLTTIIESLN